MNRRTILIVLICGMFSIMLQAAAVQCPGCRRQIPAGRKPFMVNGAPYCSVNCASKVRHNCAVCGAVCGRGSMFIKGRSICSKRCAQQVQPRCSRCGKAYSKGVVYKDSRKLQFCEQCARLPKCDSCHLPGQCRKLKDGRKICMTCLKHSIRTDKQANDYLFKIQNYLLNNLGLKTSYIIRVKLVTPGQMKKMRLKGLKARRESGLFSEKEIKQYSKGTALGLYVHNWKTHVQRMKKWVVDKNNQRRLVTVTKKQEQRMIFVVNYLPPAKFIDVVAHELGHNWMFEYYPFILNTTLSEGWAEYVAAQVNYACKNYYLNEKKQKNPDPIYGKGYRTMCNIAKNYGRKDIFNYFARKNLEGYKKSHQPVQRRRR